MTENLDPLRQKPDFLKYVSDKTGAMNDNCTVEDGCEYVWKDFVEPLMKELDALKAKVWTCPICRKDHLMPDRTCDHGSSVYTHGHYISSTLFNHKP